MFKKTLCRFAFPCLVALVTTTSVALAANWNISFQKASTTTANVSWEATSGVAYLVCWKLASAGGDVCGAHEKTITADNQSPDWFDGRMGTGITGLDTCNTSYKIRIKKKNFPLVYDTQDFYFPC